ncbi:DUF3990 domain-containing protein [Undibacterium sp. CY18W]|uniref:DUF3990 domain-containing protein n=1 Tax=Undibacterium hunanense TaxID=2762292 RepID=A0ABR6ZTH0_9BURK|nr:DUF3990 domain-containing protein [Undibacterium hunanense]MBC3919147.1 DUF3990 domain-containing protein [Undibacterium hunanense]
MYANHSVPYFLDPYAFDDNVGTEQMPEHAYPQTDVTAQDQQEALTQKANVIDDFLRQLAMHIAGGTGINSRPSGADLLIRDYASPGTSLTSSEVDSEDAGDRHNSSEDKQTPEEISDTPQANRARIIGPELRNEIDRVKGIKPDEMNIYNGASVDEVMNSLPAIIVASGDSNVATTKDDLMRSEKASDQAGNFDGRDVTESGDTLTDLFKRNYGYTPSEDELIQYANYNNLSSAHDLSVNRVIESPSLDILRQADMTDRQKNNYLARDAQYQALYASKAEEAARQPRTVSQEAADGSRKKMGGRNSEATGPITYRPDGGNDTPAMASRPIYDAMGNYSGTEWVPVDNTPVRDPVGEAIVRASRAAGKAPLEAGKGSLKSILNVGPGLINLPIAGTKLATEGYMAIGNQFGLVPNDIYQTFRNSQPWQLHTWTPSNDAQRFGQYGTDATMAAAGGSNAWSNAGKLSRVHGAEKLASYGADKIALDNSGDFTTFYHGSSPASISSIRISGIDLSKSKPLNDFGAGFYMTISRAEAIESATMVNKEQALVEFRIPKSELEKVE